MSTAGSVRSGAQTPYTPDAGGPPGEGPPRKKRTRIFRWQGIIPLLVAGVFALIGWLLFGERVVKETLTDAGTDALGTQLDIAQLRIDAAATTIELRGVALADPFDRMRNLFEVGAIEVDLEPLPLLEKKIVVRRLRIADVRTGTARATPARPATEGGFAPRAMAEVSRFVSQFNVPLLSLTNIDELRDVVLDPTRLQSVQAGLALAAEVDSVRGRIEAGYAGLRVQETLDSSSALLTRLQGVNVRELGLDGTRRAVADVRGAVARVDSARARVEGLVALARAGVDTLQAGLGRIDAARREDYAFARGLLQLPSIQAPDIGAALFGNVTIDRFQQAVYWATLAREHAPPGLLPRETDGPRRLRGSGTTVRFATPQSYPRFLLRNADANITVTSGSAAGEYVLAARDVTTDPAIVGTPMRFAIRRTAQAGATVVDSVRIVGALDHVRPRPRESVTLQAAGVRLPSFSVPALPYRMSPGRGSSELSFVMDGEQISGRWSVSSSALQWQLDSARARSLNAIESLVVRVLTGIGQLDMTAEVSGTLTAPRLAVRSNLDRQVADRLRAVVGEEVASAERRVRAQVDRIVEERTAPVRARVAELRAESERRVAEARGRLDDEKRRLEERLRALSGGLIGLPRLPGS